MSINNKEKRKRKRKERLIKSKVKIGSKVKNNILGPVFTELKSPFAMIGEENKALVVDSLGSESKKKFENSIENLRQILKEYDPISILSIISGYALVVGVGDNGVQYTEKADSTHQFQVEILHSLLLQIDEKELGKKYAPPLIVEDVINELKTLGRSFSLSRFSSEVLELNDEEKAIRGIQESIRLYTETVRNWGYFSQVKQISKELYGYLDHDLIKSIGVGATSIIEAFDFMIDSIENSLNERYQILKKIKREKYTKNQIILYNNLTGLEITNIDEIISTLKLPKLTNKNTFLFIVSHYDLRMTDYFMFSPQKISEATNITIDQATKILELFSYSLGDLKDINAEHFFLDNPIWEKPLIKIDNLSYFCSIPQVFFSFILMSLNSLIENINSKKLAERRATYLERKIAEIVQKRFPSALTVTGIKWKSDDKDYETDLVAFIDSHAIIIEAKSHKITKSALRGAPQRIKRHIDEIIIEPSIQSYRFEQYLKDLSKKDSLIDDLLQQQIPVNIRDIKKIIRVSVSLENFTIVQTNLKSLTDTGWIPEGYSPCPSMNIADFETLFDLLEHPVQIIHYLTQRTMIQSKMHFLGDELDFLGLYLGSLLNLGYLQEKKEAQLMISQMSAPIDHYYDSKGQGIAVPKPQPKISKLFQEIFTKLEDRNTPRWTEIGVLLNMLTPDDQLKLESFIKKYKSIVNRTWEKEGHHNTIIYVPPTANDMALAYVLFKNENSNKRDEYIENALHLSLEPDHVRSALIIAKNIDDNSLPYHFIALTEKHINNN